MKALEAERLVVRRPNSEDGRRACVRLSAKGMRAFEGFHRHGHELERSLSSVVSASDMAVAVKVLTSLRTFLDNLN